MKKTKKIMVVSSLIMLCVLMFTGLVGCVPAQGVTLVDVALDVEKMQKEYIMGEDINLENAILREFYSNDTFKVVQVDKTMISGFSSHEIKTVEVVVSYNERDFKIDIKIKADAANPAIVTLDVEKMQKEYVVGEDINLENATVRESYPNDAFKVVQVDKTMVSGFSSHEIKTLEVVISYKQHDFKIDVRIKANKEYDIYIVHATLPTLYSALNISQSTNETYIHYGRSGTLNNAEVPSHVKLVVSNDSVFDIIRIQKLVAKLAIENPGAHFNLYVDDIQLQWEIQIFIEAGISEDRYRLILITDGTATYGAYFNTIYGADETYSLFERNRDRYLTAKDKAKKGEDTGLKDDSYYPTELSAAAIYVAQNENVEYWLSFPESLVSKDARINQEVAKANLVAKKTDVMYAALTDEQKVAFAKLVNIDRTVFDGYFDASSKPNLVITGTSVAGSGNFANYINHIYDKYGQEYDLFFKPHPAHSPISGGVIDADLLTAKGITTLPLRIAMEALLFNYPELKIGGYNSSLYMAVPKEENVLFFLNVASGENLTAPLNFLYANGLFKKAEFLSL